MKKILVLTVTLAACCSLVAPNPPSHRRAEQQTGTTVKPQVHRNSYWSQFIPRTNSSAQLPLRIVGGVFAMVDGILSAVVNPPVKYPDGDTSNTPKPVTVFTDIFCDLFSGLFTAGLNGEGTPCYPSADTTTTDSTANY